MNSSPRFPGQRLLFTTLALLALLPAAAPAVTLMQVDDFEGGSIGDWDGGANPALRTTGGPGGAGDAYLEISRDPGFIGTYNQSSRWGGNSIAGTASDYLGEGVTAISLDVANFGPDPVGLRLVVFGFFELEAWTSTVPIAVPANGMWQNITFDLAESALTQVKGTSDWDVAVSNVNRILIRHDPGATPSIPGTGVIPGGEVTTTLGLDNITATDVIPEPSRALLLVLGAVSATVVRRRR